MFNSFMTPNCTNNNKVISFFIEKLGNWIQRTNPASNVTCINYVVVITLAKIVALVT